MSVYTKITNSQLKFFFDRYNLGTVTYFEGIANGIDNSNYFVETTQGSFVLTLFESLTLDELPYFIKLLVRLNHYHIPCPSPQADKQGNFVRLFNDKPAVIFNRLSGDTIQHATRDHCEQIGLQLAELHDCTQNNSFPIVCDIVTECQNRFNYIEPKLTATDRVLIADELAYQQAYYPDNLPKGIIHADLFKDNVLFENDKLSGILDFYSACTGDLLFDMAVTANDWCCANGILNSEKSNALLSAYESLRPLNSDEKQHWQTALRIAALRFFLSRLSHQLHPREGEITQQKDPQFFRQLLLHHRMNKRC